MSSGFGPVLIFIFIYTHRNVQAPSMVEGFSLPKQWAVHGGGYDFVRSVGFYKNNDFFSTGRTTESNVNKSNSSPGTHTNISPKTGKTKETDTPRANSNETNTNLE